MTQPRATPARRWQISLRTTILLVVVAALGLSIARDQGQIPLLRRQAERAALRHPHRLDITDPGQVATTRVGEGEFRWEVYLPRGGRYRLCLATRVGKQTDRPSTIRSAPVAPGRHILRIDRQPIGAGWRVVATWGLAERLAFDEASDWCPTARITSWSGLLPGRQQVPPGTPVLLTYRRHSDRTGRVPPEPQAPDLEVPGLKLWIETERE